MMFFKKTYPFLEMLGLINLKKVLVHEATAISLTEQTHNKTAIHL